MVNYRRLKVNCYVFMLLIPFTKSYAGRFTTSTNQFPPALSSPENAGTRGGTQQTTDCSWIFFHLGTFLKYEGNWFSFCLSSEVPGLSFSLPFSSRRPNSFVSFSRVGCFRLLVQSSKFLCTNWCGKFWHWTLMQYQGSFYLDRSSLESPCEHLSKKLPESLQIPSSTDLKIAVRTSGWSQQACGISGWKSVFFFFHDKAEKFYNLGNMKWLIYVHTQLLLQVCSYKRGMFQAQIGVQRALKLDYALPMYYLYNTVYTFNFIISSFAIK